MSPIKPPGKSSEGDEASDEMDVLELNIASGSSGSDSQRLVISSQTASPAGAQVPSTSAVSSGKEQQDEKEEDPAADDVEVSSSDDEGPKVKKPKTEARTASQKHLRRV